MAKRKKKKNKKSGRIAIRFGKSSKKTKVKSFSFGSLKTAGLAALVVLIMAGSGVGIFYLGGYVNSVSALSDKSVFLEFADMPGWVTDSLRAKVRNAATVSEEDLRIDEEAARQVHQNLTEVAWIDDVKVQATHESILVDCRWRKPVVAAKVKNVGSFYVDEELVVLDYVSMPNLPIVEVRGLSRIKSFPSLGQILRRADLEAAVDIIVHLGRMDELISADKPLLFEIEQIDVSNFNGRRSSRKPHILLYAKDGTKIIWGAEIGMWQRHLEASDQEKLASLYDFYQQQGTLINQAKYINLCDPREKLLQPIDKF